MNHLTALSAKLSRANSMLCKVRHFVDKQTLRSIYSASFSSHLTYGSQIWGQQGNANISKIISLQKIALRIITFSPFRSPTFSLFREVKILKFQDLVIISNCLFVYLIMFITIYPILSLTSSLKHLIYIHMLLETMNTAKSIFPEFTLVGMENFPSYINVYLIGTLHYLVAITFSIMLKITQ